MLWDLIQQSQISNARAEATEARANAKGAQEEIRLLQIRISSLEERLERLSLASIALAEILQDRFGLGKDEVERRVQEIDLRDGKLDCRLRAPTNDCPECHHTNAPHRRNCLYCGHALPMSSGLTSAFKANEPESNEP